MLVFLCYSLFSVTDCVLPASFIIFMPFLQLTVLHPSLKHFVCTLYAVLTGHVMETHEGLHPQMCLLSTKEWFFWIFAKPDQKIYGHNIIC